MKTLKTLAAVLVLTLVAIGAAQAGDRHPGGGNGQDIVVFDIVDSVVRETSQSVDRPAGGGVGGDIIVFDIVDS